MKDILMFVFTFAGLGVLCYVRTVGAQRASRMHIDQPEWTPQEKKLLIVAFGLIGLGLVLAFI